MKTNKLKTVLLALAGMSLFGAANAATTYTTGDLLMGFRLTTGSTNVAEVNIGPAASLVTGPLFNINAVLEAAFGVGWASNANFRGGAANGMPSLVDLFYTRSNTAGTAGTQSSTPPTITNTNYNTAIGQMATYTTGFDNYTGATYNGGLSTVISTTETYDYAGFNPGSSAFGALGNIEDSFASAGFALDLYEMDNLGASRPSTFLGTITLATNGDLAFNAAVVPEPGRASLAFLAGIMFLFRRRRA